MAEVLLKCSRCDQEIAVEMDTAILRMDVEPRAYGELVFCCPACGGPGHRHVVGDLLTLLLLVGVKPLRLSEPALPADDCPPDADPFTTDDLLAWHEALADVRFVTPWE